MTSALGALPETTAGFARLVELDGDDNVRVCGELATRYASHLLLAAQQAHADPAATEDLLTRQMEFARSRYDWTGRAHEWVEWLARLV